jgi:hypothetical protein
MQTRRSEETMEVPPPTERSDGHTREFDLQNDSIRNRNRRTEGPSEIRGTS